MLESAWAALRRVPTLFLPTCPHGTLPGKEGFEERLAMEVTSL